MGGVEDRRRHGWGGGEKAWVEERRHGRGGGEKAWGRHCPYYVQKTLT